MTVRSMTMMRLATESTLSRFEVRLCDRLGALDLRMCAINSRPRLPTVREARTNYPTDFGFCLATIEVSVLRHRFALGPLLPPVRRFGRLAPFVVELNHPFQSVAQETFRRGRDLRFALLHSL